MPLRVIDVLLQEMQTLANQHRYQEALQKGRTSLAMLPADEVNKRAFVFYNMGTIYTNLGQYAEAETQYDEAVRGIARDSDLWYNRAFNQSQWAEEAKGLGDFTGSRAHFQQALEYALEGQHLNPNDDDIRQLIALLRPSM